MQLQPLHLPRSLLLCLLHWLSSRPLPPVVGLHATVQMLRGGSPGPPGEGAGALELGEGQGDDKAAPMAAAAGTSVEEDLGQVVARVRRSVEGLRSPSSRQGQAQAQGPPASAQRQRGPAAAAAGASAMGRGGGAGRGGKGVTRRRPPQGHGLEVVPSSSLRGTVGQGVVHSLYMTLARGAANGQYVGDQRAPSLDPPPSFQGVAITSIVYCIVVM